MDPQGEIILGCRLDAVSLVIFVHDTGIGLEPAMFAKIFEVFVQAEPAGARAQGGLGIGLALVKALVELHGGKIDVRSAGLSFAFYPSQIRKIVALIRKLSNESKFGPTAVLVPNDFAFGIIHMLGILIEDVPEVRPFRDEQEARSWLAAYSTAS